MLDFERFSADGIGLRNQPLPIERGTLRCRAATKRAGMAALPRHYPPSRLLANLHVILAPK